MARIICAVAALCVFLLGQTASASAQDGAVADVLSRRAAEGDFTRAESELAARPLDAQTVAAMGMLRFARAVATLGQNLHRHGLRAPRNGFIPILRLPVPENPSPEPLTYERLRAIYASFAQDLAAVEATLARLPSGPVKLPLDLYAVRLDLNNDGRVDEEESLGRIIARLGAAGPAPQAAAPASWEVAFDRADMFWLRGYARLLSAFLEFTLAYDWRDTYAAAAHLFFSGATDPSGARADASPMLGRDSGQIADAIALIHLVRWPVAEPARLIAARDHLKNVIALSRENWKEILAETDDDREWTPAPRQKSSAFPGMQVTAERVEGWLAALDEFEAALDGRKLVPHWRYRQGVDLRAFFERPSSFDLVLWLTGHGAIPYLKDGPVISQQTWSQWQRIFAGQFLTYAIWFN